MKNKLLIISAGTLLLFYFNSCNSGTSSDNISISADSSVIAKGKASFNHQCSGCHNFRQGGIGPQLGGLTAEVSVRWIHDFIRNPKQIIESGDERSQKLFAKYKAVMPSFDALKDNEIDEIIAFLNIHKKPDFKMANKYGKEISNPIPDSIALSNMVVGLQMITQIPPSSDSGKLPLARITKLDFQRDNGALFIVDLRGKLYKLQNNKPVVYMDMAQLKPRFINVPGFATGFGSFAFHPEFAKNGLLYTTHAEGPGSGKADFSFADSIKVRLQWVLTEWKTEQPGADVFTGKGRELLRVDMVSNIHGVQEIAFNPTANKSAVDYGLLYIGIGDGGSVENGYPFLAHSREKIWGTIIRIDPMGHNSVNGQYGIPSNNPFAKNQTPNTVSEIYAYGFRNPHRISWSKSGVMLACNIGHSNIEALNIIKAGNDYGWPEREGTFIANPFWDLTKVYPLPGNDSAYNITYPVAQYDHDEGKAISGGYEYGGAEIPQLKGKYFFGDIPSGRLFYVNMADLKQGKQATIKEWRVSINGKPNSLVKICGSERVDLHFGKDQKGELYILTKADGKIYKLISATVKPS
ncbi:MAG: PQQ-dependent sugar dehydrogenase [Ginsengibacter sp.]